MFSTAIRVSVLRTSLLEDLIISFQNTFVLHPFIIFVTLRNVKIWRGALPLDNPSCHNEADNYILKRRKITKKRIH